MQALQRDAERARRLGFGAKLCIHPRQVEIGQPRLQPDRRRSVMGAARARRRRAADGAAVAVDGKMVDRPVILRAQAILLRIAEPAP